MTIRRTIRRTPMSRKTDTVTRGLLRMTKRERAAQNAREQRDAAEDFARRAAVLPGDNDGDPEDGAA